MGKRICSVPGCGKAHDSRGYCGTHLARIRNGTPMDAPLRRYRVPFDERIDRTGGADACWPWTGTVDGKGYGQHWDVRLKKRVVASRFAFERDHGPIAPGMEVCHRCDNPPCCNPAHLFTGTHQENMDDKRRKGRATGSRPHGEPA